VSEQWGSLAELTAGLTDTRAAHGKALRFTTVLMYEKQNQNSPLQYIPYLHLHVYNTYIYIIHIIYSLYYVYILFIWFTY